MTEPCHHQMRELERRGDRRDRDRDRYRDDRDRDRKEDRKDRKDREIEEKEKLAIRERYLGGVKRKKKVRKMNDRKFVFDWEAGEDTSHDYNPLYNERHYNQVWQLTSSFFIFVFYGSGESILTVIVFSCCQILTGKTTRYYT